jgi:hypothetical protein
MTKKAMILYYLIIPGFIAALIFFLVLVNSAQPEQQSTFTGEQALAFISAAQDADRMLLYGDAAAPLAAYEALPQVATNGGFPTESDCGRYFGYNIWSRKCNPDMQATFEIHFNKQMVRLLSRYPGQKEPRQLSSSFYLSSDMNADAGDIGYYKLFTHEKALIGVRSQPVSVNISFQNATHRFQVGEYSILPNFNIQTAYDFTRLSKVQDLMTLLTKEESVSPKIGYEGLTINAGGCVPNDYKELFYDVVEKMQWCALATEESCTCDIARTNLELLAEKYVIEFTNDNGVVATLKDKNEEAVETYRFEEAFEVGRIVPSQEQKPTVLLANIMRLDGAGMLFWRGDGEDRQAIGISKGLFHEKKDGKTKIGFAIDRQRENPSDPYNQLPTCTLPSLKKFRMCIDAGMGTPFKVAVDTS